MAKKSKKRQVNSEMNASSPDVLERARISLGVSALLVIDGDFPNNSKDKGDIVFHKVIVYRSTDKRFNAAALLVIAHNDGISFLFPPDYEFDSYESFKKFQIVSDKKFSSPTFLLEVATKIANCGAGKSVLVPFSEGSFSSVGYATAENPVRV